MAQERLTKTVVDKLDPGAKDYFAWCGKLSGFGVRVWPNGKKTFVVQYRAGGRGAPTRRKSLGTFGVVTVDQARKAAEDYLASAHLGNDLVGAERKVRAEMTVSQLCDEYIEHGMDTKKASTVKTDKGRINAHIRPLLGKKKISAVTRQDIERFLSDVAKGKTARDKRTSKGRSIVTGGKGTATRTARLLGGIFTYAVNQGYLEANPRKGVKLYKDGSKDRFLNRDEIDRLLQTLEEAETIGLPWELREDAKAKHRPKEENLREVLSPHVTGAIRLLLLTGCRLREILHLRWEEIDFERGFLLLPDSKTGRKTVYLSDVAVEVLRDIPRVSSYVIAGSQQDKPRSDLKRPWQRITRHAQLENLRLHDLRHTFASIAVEQNMSLYMVGKLLGHKSPETTARYAHLARDPIQRGINEIGEMIRGKPKS
ncbi:tyrosine-type recombinase/integrase [Seohaeicola saemankumensis]|uniref:tyrosine-type recombinase/integrase n=1 Tax=Seohaeicola saemankumensis TaxID=481181 RepID=UPI001E3BB92A|nr:site-specific integrase [Seohaeicola saemankumensis]MCD1626864.1 tyrosine-type recombinase/integrase [Seohaeicola saemankumensis]